MHNDLEAKYDALEHELHALREEHRQLLGSLTDRIDAIDGRVDVRKEL